MIKYSIRIEQKKFLPDSRPQTFGNISRIWAQAGESEQSWRDIKQLRAELEGPVVTKPVEDENFIWRQDWKDANI